jgi:hypothetical protein
LWIVFPSYKGNLGTPHQSLQIVYAILVLLVGILLIVIKENVPGNQRATPLREYLKHIDWAAYMSIVLISVFVITLLTAYFFPIYPDEIQSRFWLSRLPYDFPEKISGAPTCIATFFQPIPSSMYLPSLINWAVHGRVETIPALRQVGFVVAFLWVAGLAFYLNTRVKDSWVQGEGQLSRGLLGLYISGFFIAIFSIGVFPIFLIINRGEQLILPSVVLLITVFLVSERLGSQGYQWQRIGLVVLYFVAVSLILFGHPKGLFLTPLFVIVGWQLFSHFKSRLPFVFAMTLLAVHIAQNVSAFKYAFECSEVPQLDALLRSFSFDPASLLYDPRHFFDQTYQSWMRSPRYLEELGFRRETDIGYLPALPRNAFAWFANIFIKLNVSVAFLGLLVLLPFQFYRKDVVAGRFVTVNLVLLVLYGCVLTNATFNLPKNWYDAGYLYAVLLIIIIFSIGENFCGIFQKSAARKVFLYLGAVAVLSQAVFIQRNLPAFLAGFAGPGVSIAKYEAIKTHDDLEAAARSCNIDPTHSEKLVVDDYTYLYFQKSKWPMAITYIWLCCDDDSMRDKFFRQFFSKVDSDGLVVNCTPMLAPYMPFVKREGNVCCIPKNDLKTLSSLP